MIPPVSKAALSAMPNHLLLLTEDMVAAFNTSGATSRHGPQGLVAASVVALAQSAHADQVQAACGPVIILPLQAAFTTSCLLPKERSPHCHAHGSQTDSNGLMTVKCVAYHKIHFARAIVRRSSCVTERLVSCKRRTAADRLVANPYLSPGRSCIGEACPAHCGSEACRGLPWRQGSCLFHSDSPCKAKRNRAASLHVG